jgi:hypothetical protein
MFNSQVDKDVKNNYGRSIEKVLERHDTVGSINDQIVNDQLSQQQETIKRKIEERQHRFFSGLNVILGRYRNRLVKCQQSTVFL